MNDPERPQPDSFSRTASEVHDVWTAIDSLRNDVGAITNTLARVSSQIEAMADQNDKIVERQTTPWGVIVGAIGVTTSLIIAIGGAALAPLYLSDAHNSEQIKRHIESTGHPELIRSVSILAGHADGIDVDLREVRKDIADHRDFILKHNEGLASMRSTLNSIQKEIEQDNADDHTERIGALEAAVEAIILEQNRRTDRVYPRNNK